MTNIEIKLTEPILRAKGNVLTLKFKCADTPIGKKWVSALKDELIVNSDIEKAYCFLGFTNSYRDEEFLCNEINKNVRIINKYNWGGKYYITEQAVPGMSQDVSNKLHHHFELLIGQVWKVSEFYTNAPAQVQAAIHLLNNLIHEHQILTMNHHMNAGNPELCNPWTFVHFLTNRRYDLADEDYQLFDLDVKFGDVVLHYCQTGKTHLDVFHDHDDDVLDENINGLKFYSGSFDISWGNSMYGPHWEKKKKKILAFFAAKGWDINNKKLAIGYLKIAEFVREAPFCKMSDVEIRNLLGQYTNIHEIVVREEGEITSRMYPHTEKHYPIWWRNDVDRDSYNRSRDGDRPKSQNRLGSYIRSLISSI